MFIKKIEKKNVCKMFKNILVMSFQVTSANNSTTTVLRKSKKVFVCPIVGCEASITENSRDINAHLLKSHPRVAHAMNINTLYMPSYICHTCNKYTTLIHFHCHTCTTPVWFPSKPELETHLKSAHGKWYTETACKHGDACYGYKNGKCGFNHLTIGIEIVFDPKDLEMPFGFCRNDRPWDGVRCSRVQCKFDHFRGRVRFNIKTQENALNLPIAPSLCTPCISFAPPPPPTTLLPPPPPTTPPLPTTPPSTPVTSNLALTFGDFDTLSISVPVSPPLAASPVPPYRLEVVESSLPPPPDTTDM